MDWGLKPHPFCTRRRKDGAPELLLHATDRLPARRVQVARAIRTGVAHIYQREAPAGRTLRERTDDRLRGALFTWRFAPRTTFFRTGAPSCKMLEATLR